MSRAEMPDLETARLTKAAQNGDRSAFSSLVRKFDSKNRSIAFGMMRSQAGMDDALQDAYIKAYKSLGKLEQASSFQYWLRRIVVTTCLDHLRAGKRRQEVPLDELTLEPAGDSLQNDFELATVLDSAMNQLSEDHRILIELIDGQSMSYAEVGLILDVNVGTIASRTSRAREQMRELLTAAGVRA